MSIGIGTVLTIVFLVLKLTGYISWSWLWVTAPAWISALIQIAIVIGVVMWKRHIEKEMGL